ncbi:MAG: hypothetical protein LBI55_01605, partial [Oscillospiraceae bacterium]|nr:hypothetical protein [Oscillospiraceae bacterium]
MRSDMEDFYITLNTDPELRSEVRFLRSNYPSGILGVKDTYNFINRDLIPLARSRGYNFTLEEYIEHGIREEQGNLTERELVIISGGRSITPSMAKIIGLVGAGALAVVGTGVHMQSKNKANSSQTARPENAPQKQENVRKEEQPKKEAEIAQPPNLPFNH